jgi:PAS domain S-box-containing protein
MTDLNEGRIREHDKTCQSIPTEPFFDILIDAIPCPIYYNDTKGIYIGYNKAFGDQILGPNGCRIIGRSMSEFEKCIPSELLELMLHQDAELLHTPGRQVYEISMPCADGNVRHFSIHKSGYTDPAGHLAGIIGIMLDISAAKKAQSQLVEYHDHLEQTVAERSADLINTNTKLSQEIEQRRKTEKALKSSEELHRRVFENTGTATVLIDPDMTISMANAKFESLIGLSREQFLGKTDFLEFIAPVDRERLNLYYELGMQGDDRFPLRTKFKITDTKGQIKELLATTQWIPETLQVIVSMLDVTTSNQMQRERNRLAAVIEQSAEAVIITDTHGRVEYANPAFEMLSGYNRIKSVGHDIEAPFFSDRDRDVFKRLTFMVTKDDMWSGRVENRHRDGHTYIADTHIFPIFDERGKAVNLVCVKSDATYELQLEKQLQHAHKMEAIGTLAGGIAHDFNNILGGILGFTELSMRLAVNDERLQRNFGRIVEGCQRAKELIRNILTFSRESDEETKPIEMQIIVKEALKLLRASIPSTIEIRKRITTEPSIIQATPTQIHQVIMNLCTNAAQAMNANGGLLEVILENIEPAEIPKPDMGDTTPGPYARLTVRDSGRGMADETLEHIFEPYFTTRTQIGGTGLGLSVVHGIVQNSGGYIEVKSRPGTGTEFVLLFPRIEASIPAVKGGKPDVPKAAANERILVVDDEAYTLEIMSDMLSDLKYRVETADSGQKALALLHEADEPYELIIADLTMPKMTGHQLAEQARLLHPGIPVVLITGSKVDALGQQRELSIFSAVLLKPILFADLAATLHRILSPTD